MSNSNEPSQASGQFHSVKGQAVEGIGNLTGSTEWQTSGKKEHAEGEGEQKAAQAKGYAEGECRGVQSRFGPCTSCLISPMLTSNTNFSHCSTTQASSTRSAATRTRSSEP